jgi:hypothetical protein
MLKPACLKRAKIILDIDFQKLIAKFRIRNFIEYYFALWNKHRVWISIDQEKFSKIIPRAGGI